MRFSPSPIKYISFLSFFCISASYGADVNCSSGSYTISSTGLSFICSPSTSGDNVILNSGNNISIITNATNQDAFALGTYTKNAGLIINQGSINTTGVWYGRGIGVTNGMTAKGIINTGTIITQGHGIELGYNYQQNGKGGNITGFDGSLVGVNNTILAIYNSGRIETNGGGSAIRIARNSTLNGSIYNAGIMQGDGIGINFATSDTTLNGSIINTNQIIGGTTGIYNTGNIVGDISNQGTIKGISANSNGIYNIGTINLLNNYNTISGTTSSINTDTGTFTNGINNYGVLDGNVILGDNTLNLLGENPSGSNLPNLAVNGDISGRDNSTINLDHNAIFTTNGNASVGRINVASGSTLVLSETATWSANAGNFNNYGSVKFNTTTNNATLSTGATGAFYNYGVLDLTTKNPNGQNNLVGSTLTINSNYVSEGGSIYLNTLLDNAESNNGKGTSDLVVITGNVTTGASATKLYILPTANSPSLGQLTVGNGIKVIDVQGNSSSDAFTLGSPLARGAYEYTLNQGSADNNWYLSSYYKGYNTPNYNPSIGSYLANQTAAIQMFQQSLFDRLVSSSELTNDSSKRLFWLKTKMNHGSYNSIHGNFSNRTKTYITQMGGDIGVWSLNNGGYFHLGIMAGYGDFEDTSKSRVTNTKAEGKVKGYSTGIYGTYFANQDTNIGFYADLWSQISWYRNEVSGKAQVATKKYNSSLWSNSIELGYGIVLGKTATYEWLATPQIQLTYNYYDVKNQLDKNNLFISNNDASGLDSRVGVRFHVRQVEKDLINPFLEVNLLDTTNKNSLAFNGNKFKDGFAKNRLEAIIGIEGNYNERLSSSIQLGGQWGNNSTKSYNGQFNINYRF